MRCFESLLLEPFFAIQRLTLQLNYRRLKIEDSENFFCFHKHAHMGFNLKTKRYCNKSVFKAINNYFPAILGQMLNLDSHRLSR